MTLGAEAAERIYRAAGATPLVPYPGRIADKWSGTCNTCGREVQPTVKDLQRGQGPCWPCGKKRAGQKQTKSEAEALEIYLGAGATPTVPYPGRRHLPWPGTCNTCGAEVSPTVKDLRNGTGPCVPCGKKAAGRTQATSHEDALAVYLEAGGIPDGPFPGRRDLPWLGQCAVKGHPIRPSLDSLLMGRGCCLTCANENRKPRKDEAQAEALYRVHGGEPTSKYPGMRKRWPGVCLRCGADVQPVLHDVVHNDVSVCAGCNERNRIAKKRLSVEEAEQTYRDAGGIPDPNIPYPGVKAPWPGTCAGCGNTISPRLNNIRNGAGPCSVCGDYGFNKAVPSVLYLVAAAGDMIKVGIANENAFANRLTTHARVWGGTILLDTREGTGQQVVEWERRILTMLDAAGVLRGSAAWERFDGYTETWSRTQLDVATLSELEDVLAERMRSAAGLESGTP